MQALWEEAVRDIEPKVKPAHRDQWLRPIKCLAIDGRRIRLSAPNRYQKEWFEDNYLPSILQSLESRAHHDFAVDFELADEGPAPALALPLSASAGAKDPGLRDEGPPPPPSPKGLDSRYTFEKFVVGPTNQFAHAAARMVAEAPASKFNPLFIYGGVGLGKTHLLHAIGHEIHREHPEWNIACITCERFVTEFIGSIRSVKKHASINPMDEFRQRYREVPDVLLIDDVQFLSNKDSSQDEFFHTFNALHLAHKQIVLTCDKLPGELSGLEDRLRSRFTWGLIAEVAVPDLETRTAIVKRKAELDSVALPDDVAHHIAALVRSNVRELEGALLRITARSAIEQRPITRQLADEALKSYTTARAPLLSIDAIQREVALYFDVKLVDLKGPKRHRAIAHPRAIAMFLARKLTSMSYPEIGSRFGGKDHSTVISAVRKIERTSSEDSALHSQLQTLEGHLRVG